MKLLCQKMRIILPQLMNISPSKETNTATKKCKKAVRHPSKLVSYTEISIWGYVSWSWIRNTKIKNRNRMNYIKKWRELIKLTKEIKEKRPNHLTNKD